MKTKQVIGAAFATLLMASCSNELPVEEAGGSLFGSVPKGMVEYQFRLSGITPTTSYATVALEEAEMAIDSMTVIVTQIKAADQASAKVYGVFPAVRKDNIASIQMPKEFDLGDEATDGKQIRFVIVANNLWTSLQYDHETHQHPITSASTYADVTGLYVQWGPTSEIEANYVVKPIGLPSYDIVDVDRPEEGDVLKITSIKLKRPLARFDVRNNTQGLLNITKVGLANMRQNGYLLDGTVVGELVTKDHFANLPTGINEFDEDLKASYQPGLFYLPPGNAVDKLTLLIEATSTADGSTLNYTLPLSNAGGEIAVVANKRYMIDIKKINGDIMGSITPGYDGWGDGSGGGGGGGGENDYDYDFTPAPTPDPVP